MCRYDVNKLASKLSLVLPYKGRGLRVSGRECKLARERGCECGICDGFGTFSTDGLLRSRARIWRTSPLVLQRVKEAARTLDVYLLCLQYGLNGQRYQANLKLWEFMMFDYQKTDGNWIWSHKHEIVPKGRRLLTLRLKFMNELTVILPALSLVDRWQQLRRFGFARTFKNFLHSFIWILEEFGKLLKCVYF